jgi:hypothetical protein
MIARPRRKSRLDTQPGSTTYTFRRGITTGPPPKMIVPARYILTEKIEDEKRCLENPADDNYDDD